LFNVDAYGNVRDAKYELTICAQILEIEYKKRKKDLKVQVAKIIKEAVNDLTIDKDNLDELKEFFKMHQNINIITTNYDTLFSDHIISGTSRVIIEGSVMPRLNSGQNIYHIHGCTIKPESIVLTLNDYYNFQNLNNYFSRKFYTLLQETTVAIIGYSLGDFNLNTILSEVKNSKKESFRKTDIYYINKGEIPEVISKFYSLTYGIRTIQNKKIDQFFSSIETKYKEAKELIESIEVLREVISGTKIYTDDFLKLRVSLPTILMQAATIGIDTTDTGFLKTLLDILEKKREFTYESNAWVQYEHLADWLIEVASVVLIKSTMIEAGFCELVKYSFKKSSRKLYKGYSWYAWKEWNARWHEMKLENQIMLQELIENNAWDGDLEITELYK
jgi:hypothetical protein